MESQQEVERVKEENRVLCDRLTKLEEEIAVKDDSSRETKAKNNELIENLRKYQQKIKELEKGLADSEAIDYQSRGEIEGLRSLLEEDATKHGEEVESYRTMYRDCQREIKSIAGRLEDMEEKYHMVGSQLESKRQRVLELELEKDRRGMDANSRIANLNQALLQSKQVCAQVEARNEQLLEQEKMMLGECSTLEKRCGQLTTQIDAGPCTLCREREKMLMSKKESEDVHRCVSTPIRHVPAHGEIERLHSETGKLKQKYDCLLANFQMVSDKSGQMKKDMKELEGELVDSHTRSDNMRTEKEGLEREVKKFQHQLSGHQGVDATSKQKLSEVKQEVVALSRQLEELQTRHCELQDRYSNSQSQLQNSQNNITHLHSQVASLRTAKAETDTACEALQHQLHQAMDEVSHLKEQQVGSQPEDDNMAALSSDSLGLQEATREQEKLMATVGQLHKHLATSEQQKDSLVLAQQKFKTSIECLKQQLEKAEAHRATAASVSEELNSLKPKLVALSERNEELESEKHDMESVTSSSSSQIQSLKQSSARYQQESKESWNLVKKLQTELDGLAGDHTHLLQQLKEREDRCKVLTREGEQLKMDQEAILETNWSLENDIAQLTIKIDELENANFELDCRVTELGTNTSSLRTTSSDAQCRLEEAHRKLVAAQNVLYEQESQLNHLRISKELAEKENKRLLHQLDQLSESLADSTSEVDLLRRQINQHNYDTQDITEQIAAIEELHQYCRPAQLQLEEKIERLKSELHSANSKLSQGSGATSGLKSELKQVKEYNRSLEKTVHDLESSLQSQSAVNDKLSLSVEKYSGQAQQLDKKVRALNESLSSARKEVDEALSERDELYSKLQRERDNLEQRYYKLQDSHDNLQREKSSLEANVLDMGTTTDSYQQNLLAMEEEMRTMVDKVGEMEAGKDYFQKQAESLQRELKNAKHTLHQQNKKIREKERCIDDRCSQVVDQFKSLRKHALNVLADTPRNNKDGEDDGIHVLGSLENLQS